MIRAVGLSQGFNSPSSRFRVHQIADWINNAPLDITLDVLVSTPGAYPPKSKGARATWILRGLLDSLKRVQIANSFEVCLLHRELISTINSFEGLIKIPTIFDVDDAIWLTSRLGSIERICRSSEHLIAGNDHIADRLGSLFNRVSVIPTAVDSNRFSPDYASQEMCLVWSGSSSGLYYLYNIEAALKTVLQMNKGWKLRVVCNEPPKFAQLSDTEFEFIQWSPYSETESLRTASIGIMPLRDTEWERAKCSYKMLTYMSCGLPVVVSPIGMNSSVLDKDNVGLSASSESEWVEAIDHLMRDCTTRMSMGVNGRNVILENFDLPMIAKQVSRVLREYSK